MAYHPPYPNWVFSLFAFIGFLMCTVPLPWHLEAWNIGTCSYMVWVGLGCLFNFVNSVVWTGNAINHAPIWCDIVTRFLVGLSWGVPAALFCISRRLYNIVSVKTVTVSRAERRRGIIVDLVISFGLPTIGMILYYIPQPRRFHIIEDIGCLQVVSNTVVGLVLVILPPIAITCASAVYCALSIRALLKQRALLKEMLSGHSNLSSSRYTRLIALASANLLLNMPLNFWMLSMNIMKGFRPWISWAYIHSDMSHFNQTPTIQWRSDRLTETSLELSRWAPIICAFVFFGFFGFADEARKNYGIAASTVAKKVGLAKASLGGTIGIWGSTSRATDIGSTGGGTSKGGLGSMGKVGPQASIEIDSERLRGRRRSIDSFTDVSVTNPHDPNTPPSANEKAGFSPTQSYGAFELSDAGGTLADYKAAKVSPPASSGSSSTSSFSTYSPEPPIRDVSRAGSSESIQARAAITISPALPVHQSDRSAV